jgi:hypothetical protein
MEPIRYEIKEVKDFLNIPEDRVDAALDEFRDWVKVSRNIESMLISDSMKAIIKLEAFVWIDDGKKEVKLVVDLIDDQIQK